MLLGVATPSEDTISDSTLFLERFWLSDASSSSCAGTSFRSTLRRCEEFGVENLRKAPSMRRIKVKQRHLTPTQRHILIRCWSVRKAELFNLANLDGDVPRCASKQQWYINM
jgi:hypothetical protein